MPNEDRSSNGFKRPYNKPALVQPVTAQDYKEYIGQIVNNTYNGCYCEVMAVIDGYVIVKNAPNRMPEAVSAAYLNLDFSGNGR